MERAWRSWDKVRVGINLGGHGSGKEKGCTRWFWENVKGLRNSGLHREMKRHFLW